MSHPVLSTSTKSICFPSQVDGFPNQDSPARMSMINVFNKFAVVIPLKEHKAIHIMPAIFKAFTMIGKQPEILYTDDEGALTDKRVAAEFEGAGIQHRDFRFSSFCGAIHWYF